MSTVTSPQLPELVMRKLNDARLTVDDKHRLLASSNKQNRLDILAHIHKHTLENLFKKNPRDFHTPMYHYDWWAFPLYVLPEWRDWSLQSRNASVDPNEAKILLQNDFFMDAYLQTVSMYLNACKTQGWNNYTIRYAKMLLSLKLFLTASYELNTTGSTESVHSTLLRLSGLARDAVEYGDNVVSPSLTRRFDLLSDGLKELKEVLNTVKSSSIP